MEVNPTVTPTPPQNRPLRIDPFSRRGSRALAGPMSLHTAIETSLHARWPRAIGQFMSLLVAIEADRLATESAGILPLRAAVSFPRFANRLQNGRYRRQL